MSVNTMNFEQAAQVLNGLVQQATGQTSLAPVDLSQYISVGQKALRIGYDPLAIGISQMVGRTIFAYRPYTSALSILRRTDEEYGAITRKISAIQQPYEAESVYDLTDGEHPDMFEVRKPKLWQANFYGFDIWSDHISITRQQLKNAVTNPADLGRLMDLVLGTKANEMENGRETFERATLANLIGALNAMGNANQVRHLLTEYNTILTAAGKTALTNVTVYDPDNYSDFMKWVYSRIQTVRDFMTERSINFHLNVPNASKFIQRHTPYNRQILYMYAPELRQMEARVLSAAFNEGRLEYKSIELVNYWQSIETPTDVNAKIVSIDGDGAVDVAAAAATTSNVFALLVDDDAMGYTRYSEGMYATPINARGRYTNFWYHWRWQQYVDLTENMVLFLLD